MGFPEQKEWETVTRPLLLLESLIEHCSDGPQRSFTLIITTIINSNLLPTQRWLHCDSLRKKAHFLGNSRSPTIFTPGSQKLEASSQPMKNDCRGTERNCGMVSWLLAFGWPRHSQSHGPQTSLLTVLFHETKMLPSQLLLTLLKETENSGEECPCFN